MDSAILIDRVRQMRDSEAEWLSDLEGDRRTIEAGIEDLQTDLEKTDRSIAVRKQIISEYQELIALLERQ
jgi:hypothetical protein